MAEYEIEWTETRKRRARIQAPPNDDRMLEAAKTMEVDPRGRLSDMPLVIVWAVRDDAVEAVRDENGKPDITYTITLVGRVEIVSVNEEISEERVRPL